VLRAVVDAEHEYYAELADSGASPEYAQHLNSSQGQRNGLYWPAGGDADASPIGPYVAQASYNRSARMPLHGYYFRVLTDQGPHAPGGARHYLVNGKMTGGFAFVAFPAEYRSSGVETFIAGEDGAVYEKDLGPRTAQIASAMSAFDPDPTWTKVP
jgi:Protein of unknown function (DUF2950)